MSMTGALIRRNMKLFFKDKGLFFTSLVTPLILLVLYTTFLGNVFTDVLTNNIPGGMALPDGLIDGVVGGLLISSILAVSSVTVAFSSNLLMVQDKVTGSIKDLSIAPVKPAVLSMSYYISTFISTLIICFTAMIICFAYVMSLGWYLSVTDVLYLMLDIVLLALFGTALSSIINTFLSTQGQISAVSTIISAGYGFICGAYMPISSFSEALQNALSLLPSTYGTALVRNHAMQGALAELQSQGVPEAAIEGIRDALGCDAYFYGTQVDIPTMYLILAGSVAILIAIYVLMHTSRKTA